MADAGLHLVIACGGTGGHFFPTLAIGREFRRQGGQVTLLVAGHHSRDQVETARRQDLPAIEVPATRLPRGPVTGVKFLWHFPRSVLAARRRLRELRPDLVLGMGSFASGPTCLAALFCRLPLMLHEGNSRTGLANRLLSHCARGLATSLPPLPGQACRCPVHRTGMPLREDVIRAAQTGTLAPGFLEQAGLVPGTPTLLVFGGSQGARFINDLVRQTAELLEAETAAFQLIHLTGTDDNEARKQAYAAAGLRAWVRRADEHIENCYLAAGLVVCRGGASTISELALFAKPAILIPLPTAADDHQTANASVMANLGAARHLPQAEATPPRLADLLREWLRSPQTWQDYGAKIGATACPDAAAAVARLMWTAVGRRGSGDSEVR